MREQTEKEKGICGLCGHSLENNIHGFDQNDAHMEGDKLVHHGTRTYCRKCNPGIFKRRPRPRLSTATWDRLPEEAREEILIYFGVNREDLNKYAVTPWNELPTWLHERWAREVEKTGA